MCVLEIGNVAACLYVDGTDSGKREKPMLQGKEGKLEKCHP